MTVELPLLFEEVVVLKKRLSTKARISWTGQEKLTCSCEKMIISESDVLPANSVFALHFIVDIDDYPGRSPFMPPEVQSAIAS